MSELILKVGEQSGRKKKHGYSCGRIDASNHQLYDRWIDKNRLILQIRLDKDFLYLIAARPIIRVFLITLKVFISRLCKLYTIPHNTQI